MKIGRHKLILEGLVFFQPASLFPLITAPCHLSGRRLRGDVNSCPITNLYCELNLVHKTRQFLPGRDAIRSRHHEHSRADFPGWLEAIVALMDLSLLGPLLKFI